MCYLITLTNYMEITYHNNNTVILFEKRPLQVCNSIFGFVKQVGHQRLLYFYQAVHDCCVVPATTFNNPNRWLYMAVSAKLGLRPREALPCSREDGYNGH